MFPRKTVVALLAAFAAAANIYESAPSPLAYLFPALPAKLIFCRIAKSASTPATRFILRILDNPLWNTTAVHDHKLTNLAQLPRTQAAALLADREMTRAVVARDPVERFASGFVDKCIKRRDWNCPAQGKDMGSVSAVISALERTGISSAACNAHFRSASSVCLLNESVREFVIVPYADLFAGWSQVVRSLKNIHPVQRREFELWTRQTFDLRYEKNKFIRAATLEHRTNSTDLASMWRHAAAQGDATAAAVLKRLCRLYEEDYAIFKGVLGVASRCEEPMP
jgi:hypothetical protein